MTKYVLFTCKELVGCWEDGQTLEVIVTGWGSKFLIYTTGVVLSHCRRPTFCSIVAGFLTQSLHVSLSAEVVLLV